MNLSNPGPPFFVGDILTHNDGNAFQMYVVREVNDETGAITVETSFVISAETADNYSCIGEVG